MIDLCLKFHVTRLVYTSSYNVIFSNKSLENIDESEPYPDDKDQYDYYSRSKKAAEILLLEYDGTRLGKSLVLWSMIPNRNVQKMEIHLGVVLWGRMRSGEITNSATFRESPIRSNLVWPFLNLGRLWCFKIGAMLTTSFRYWCCIKSFSKSSFRHIWRQRKL